MIYKRKIPVEFNHCDPAGIVYFPRFFGFFHDAMETWFAGRLGLAYASVVVGPAAAHFGWERTAYDELAGAMVAGHVIECGAHATGGGRERERHQTRPGAGIQSIQSGLEAFPPPGSSPRWQRSCPARCSTAAARPSAGCCGCRLPRSACRRPP